MEPIQKKNSQEMSQSQENSEEMVEKDCVVELTNSIPRINDPEIVCKFKHYQKKILNDQTLEKELDLFIDARASSSTDNHRTIFELSFDIKKHFLQAENGESPMVLLLTGQAGVGKSLFCKHFQRELLSIWGESFQNEESLNRNWFPIYVDLSSLKNPKSQAISETLVRELSLTEEEVFRFQVSCLGSEQSEFLISRLLFIFDGYDAIEDFAALHMEHSEKVYACNNFCKLNKIKQKYWKNAKFIITCREENVQNIKRRDLLFAPINTKSLDFRVQQGSFFERKIEPFADEQVSCYLKKYCISKFSEMSEEWERVANIQKMINDHQSREIARIPFMLSIILQILPNIALNGIDTQPKMFSRRFLMESFVDGAIRSISKDILDTSACIEYQEESKYDTQEEEILQEEKVWKKLMQGIQNLALKLHGYSINTAGIECGLENNSYLLKLHPLVACDKNQSRLKFSFPLVLEFLLAKSIVEEINGIIPLKQNEQLIVPKEFLFNQRLLKSNASDAIILFFLRDAIRDQKLAIDQLKNLIYLSLQKNLELGEIGEDIQPTNHPISNSPFSIVAANAITLLNFEGYDFSGQDFTNVSIPGANLSHGIFEGVNFKNADLRGVDFSGTWLKDVMFENSNLRNIEFGETPSYKIIGAKEARIFQSKGGKYFAVGIEGQTAFFESANVLKTCLKHVRTLPGTFLDWIDNFDGKQIKVMMGRRIEPENGQTEENKDPSNIEIKEEQTRGQLKKDKKMKAKKKKKETLHISLQIWDIISGQCSEKIEAPLGNKKFVHFDSTKKEVIVVDNECIQKYNIACGAWVRFPKFPFEILNTKNLHLSPISSNLLLAGDRLNQMLLYNIATGKYILRQRQSTVFCKFSSDGKEIVSGNHRRTPITISDCIRGHIIKSLLRKPGDIVNCSFNIDGKQIIFTTQMRRVVQNVVDGKEVMATIFPKKLSIHNSYAFDRDGQQFVWLDSSGAIIFHKLARAKNSSLYTTIRGNNSKELNLQGSISNNSVGLSMENAKTFYEKGDYKIFQKEMFNKLFSKEPETVRDAILPKKMALALIHARIIGSDKRWINLRKLDLSLNNLGDEGGVIIANNKAWPNLEDLILVKTKIGNQTAESVANNQTWTKLKRLILGGNQIGNIGATGIGKSKLWADLEVIDLKENKIQDKGAAEIGENQSWTKLSTLDLSLNKIKDISTFFLLSKNKTWKDLKELMLQDNSVSLKNEDALVLLESIASSKLEVLKLPHIQFNKVLIECLKYSEHQSVTEVISKNSGISNQAACIIGSNTTWINLRKLHLPANVVEAEGGVKIGSNVAWINLEELDLTNNKIEAKGGIAIGENQSWKNLRVLKLNANKIGLEGACALGKNPWWINLQTLDFGRNSIGDKGIAELSLNTAWVHLKTLNLAFNEIGAAGIKELCQNTTWIHLQTLDLEGNTLGDKGAAEISQFATWTNLGTLILSGNNIGDKGVTDLSQNITWTNLQALILESNLIKSEGATELSKNTTWGKLQTLNLGYNSLGSEGVIGLSKNTTWTDLQALVLTENKIDEKGIAELRKNATWSNLRVLDLSKNSIDDKGATELSQNTTWTHLQTLTLSNNKISWQGIAELSKITTWTHLERLKLDSSKIGNQGVALLSKNKTWPHLQELQLRNNGIDEKGVAQLRKNVTWSNLRSLDLARNNIQASGALELSKNTTWKFLQKLNLRLNELGDKGAVALSQNTTWTRLKILNLRKNWINEEKTYDKLKQNMFWPMQIQILK